jgi:hypothetical protein
MRVVCTEAVQAVVHIYVHSKLAACRLQHVLLTCILFCSPAFCSAMPFISTAHARPAACCLPHHAQLVAPNSTAYNAPEDAGLPMGTPASQYLSLELHYNNPEGLEGGWAMRQCSLASRPPAAGWHPMRSNQQL